MRWENKVWAFIEKMNSMIQQDVSPHSRRHDAKLHCSKWISLRHMKEDVESSLGPDDVAPCEE